MVVGLLREELCMVRVVTPPRVNVLLLVVQASRVVRVVARSVSLWAEGTARRLLADGPCAGGRSGSVVCAKGDYPHLLGALALGFPVCGAGGGRVGRSVTPRLRSVTEGGNLIE